MYRALSLAGLATVGLLGSSVVRAQSPFFCKEVPNHGFDCVEHANILDPNTVLCPDPLEDPWCACLKTYSSSMAPGGKPSITQEVLYREGQPTAGSYAVDVPRGTLDLSTVSPGDVVFHFLICVDKDALGQPFSFELDFEALVTAKDATSADVDLTLPPETGDNPVTVAILRYNPVDEAHSFGKTYEGRLVSRGPGKGFTFEYHLYEPDPLSASPLRGLEDGDLDSPGFTVEALLSVTDGDVGLYTSPPCGKVSLETTITPKAPIAEVTEKIFSHELDFGAGDYTVGISGEPNAAVGGTVVLTATTNAAEPPAYAWEVTAGTAILTDNHDGTASVTSDVAGQVTVRLTGAACSTSKTAELTITFAVSGGRQKPGDCNQDGKLDLSDALCVLGHLFLGTVAVLPCGTTAALAGEGDLKLLDCNTDRRLDLSDALCVLGSLFLGSPPPAACAGDVNCPCILIPDCPDNSAKCP